MQLAQFELRKWVASNNLKIIQTVPEEARGMSPSLVFKPMEHTELKLFGLKWELETDNLFFLTQFPLENPTKRVVLSALARVFDLLGLFSPAIF